LVSKNKTQNLEKKIKRGKKKKKKEEKVYNLSIQKEETEGPTQLKKQRKKTRDRETFEGLAKGMRPHVLGDPFGGGGKRMFDRTGRVEENGSLEEGTST